MRMIETGVSGVEFIAINTDLQALDRFDGIAASLNIGENYWTANDAMLRLSEAILIVTIMWCFAMLWCPVIGHAIL